MNKSKTISLFLLLFISGCFNLDFVYDAPKFIDDISEKTLLSVDSYDDLEECVEIYDLNRPLNHIKKVELVKGDIAETLPKFLEENPYLVVSLLYLDFDIYKPTKIALEYLAPLVCKGGIIVFDECNYDKFPGETQALKKYFKLNETEIKRFYFNGCYF